MKWIDVLSYISQVKEVFDTVDTNKDRMVSHEEVIEWSISDEHKEIFEELLTEDNEDEENEGDGQWADIENEITEQEDSQFGSEIKHEDL